MWIKTAIFLTLATVVMSLRLSSNNGRVYFHSPTDLHDCTVVHEGGGGDGIQVPLKFTWRERRGYFIPSLPGTYTLRCNEDSGSIEVQAHLGSRTATPTLPIPEENFDGHIDEAWQFVNIYTRPETRLDQFGAFYEQSPIRRNISRADALDFIANELSATHTLAQIHVDPVFWPVTPNFGQEPEEQRPRRAVDVKSPLLDGTMGWVKAMNFSAHERLCGKGANLHFFDDGYHLGHEDLANPRIKVRRQISTCTDFTKYCDHGTASLGILAAEKNDFGIEGLARCADSINLYSYTFPVEAALEYAEPGDIYGINVQYCMKPNCQGGEMYPFACTYPAIVNLLHENGIVVVQSAGNAKMNLSNYERCKNQAGAQFGFVVSATVRNSDLKRDLGVSDIGVGWFTNYNHANCIFNHWGERVTTTYATKGDTYFGGKNRGYGPFSGTSSATPLAAATATVLQGYMRSRCPGLFLDFDDLAEIFRNTGSPQQLPYQMGYEPNLYAGLDYIETHFVSRCNAPPQNPDTCGLEAAVPSYDDLQDPWRAAAKPRPATCADSIDLASIQSPYISEIDLIAWTVANRDIVICQSKGNWKYPALYLPAVTAANYERMRMITLTVIRESGNEFRVVPIFGKTLWNLALGQHLTISI